MNRYDDILARLRAATGPDERTDILIENVLGIAVFQRDPKVGYGDADYNRVLLRPYTARVDAALALVEEKFPGWDWNLSNNPPGFYLGEMHGEDEDFAWSVGDGKTAPLAILTALFQMLEKRE